MRLEKSVPTVYFSVLIIVLRLVFRPKLTKGDLRAVTLVTSPEATHPFPISLANIYF